MMTVLITLTTTGTDTGPFNLYSNIDGYIAAFEFAVPKVDLEAGYISTVVPDTTTTIRVQSINALCSNYVDLAISGFTTTTTTSTSSTTTSTTTTEDLTADVNIALNVSQDIEITELKVNVVDVIITSGAFPNTPGNSTFGYTDQIGTYDVAITYNAFEAGQRIRLTDSAANVFCQNTTSGSFIMTFSGCIVNASAPVTIEPLDGVC